MPSFKTAFNDALAKLLIGNEEDARDFLDYAMGQGPGEFVVYENPAGGWNLVHEDNLQEAAEAGIVEEIVGDTMNVHQAKDIVAKHAEFCR